MMARHWLAERHRWAMACALALCLGPAQAIATETRLTAPGAPEDVVDRLRAGSLVVTAEERGLTDPQEVLSAALADYRTLIGLLYDQGYFGPEISIQVDGREAANIPPLSPPSQIDRIDINVITGPKYSFGRATIQPLAPGTELPETYARGQTASTRAVQDAARASVRAWRAVGHAKANIGDQQIVVDHINAELDSDLTVLPGPRVRFGNVTVTGNKDVRTDAILRIAGFPEGEVYDPEQVEKVANRLRRTGTFGSVSLTEAETANPDGTLDFEISAAERLPRRISFGAEIATEEGVELSVGWMHRNIFGAAERLAFDARVRNIGGTEDIDGLIALRLDRPAAFGVDFDHFILGEIERAEETFYKIDRALIGTGVRRIFSDDLFGELAIAFERARSEDVFGTRDFTMVLFPGRVEWDRRNNKVDATQGFYVDVRAMPYGGFQDTETGFRGFVDTRGYIGFGEDDRVVLAGRLQLGTVIGSSLEGTSPAFTFYSGGAGTVRGQPYQSLGVDVDGGTAGGRAFLGLSAEIRARVADRISVVGFYDHGAVDKDSFVGSSTEYHSGAGLGVRYDLGGIGPIRLDLGWPVSGDTGDGLQFYLGIGQAF
ncbi:MAG: autotransporter assembly complex family protein [Pseudomonadota bacterium]